MDKHASNVSRSPPGKGHEVIGECIRHDLAVLDKGPRFVGLAAWPCLASISSIDLSISIYLYLSLSISTYLFLSTYLPIYLSIYLSTCLSVCLCLSFCLSILLIKVSLNCCASTPFQRNIRKVLLSAFHCNFVAEGASYRWLSAHGLINKPHIKKLAGFPDPFKFSTNRIDETCMPFQIPPLLNPGS